MPVRPSPRGMCKKTWSNRLQPEVILRLEWWQHAVSQLEERAVGEAVAVQCENAGTFFPYSHCTMSSSFPLSSYHLPGALYPYISLAALPSLPLHSVQFSAVLFILSLCNHFYIPFTTFLLSQSTFLHIFCQKSFYSCVSILLPSPPVHLLLPFSSFSSISFPSLCGGWNRIPRFKSISKMRPKLWIYDDFVQGR
jgi:hypothetical protein